MVTKDTLYKFIAIFILIVGTIIAIILVQQPQLFQKQAAVTDGPATVSIAPTTGDLILNQSSQIIIAFNSNGIPISAITTRLSHTSTNITLSNIQINSSLLASGDWSCPIRTISGSTLDIACINTNPTGFTSSTNTTLATFDLTPTATPNPNPVVLTFDPSQSIITKKSDGSDILAIPASSGTYTFSTTTPTPTPEGSTPTPTPTPAPGEPNSCGGTCGSNVNCKAGLFCYQGFCRNPICKTSSNCICTTPTPTPTPTPKPKTTPTPEIVDYTETPPPTTIPGEPLISPTPSLTGEPTPTTSPKLPFYILLAAIAIPAVILLVIAILIIKKLSQINKPPDSYTSL